MARLLSAPDGEWQVEATEMAYGFGVRPQVDRVCVKFRRAETPMLEFFGSISSQCATKASEHELQEALVRARESCFTEE